MSEKKSGSMNSVWDTLNAMKRRREAAETAVPAAANHAAGRKAASTLFEAEVNRLLSGRAASGAAAAISDGEVQTLLRAFHTHCAADDEAHRLCEEYEARAVGRPDVALREVREGMEAVSGHVSVAKHALRKAERIANGLCAFTD